MVELIVMLAIVIGSIIVSPLLGYQPRIGGVYSEESAAKDAGESFFKKDGKEDEEAIFETRASHGASDEEGSLTDTNGNLTHAPSLATEVTPRGEPGGWTA
eukprot:symbB.v1.2.015590.t1/scaffold1127.1/size253144/12